MSPEVIFGLEPAAAAARVQGVVGPVIEGAGLPVALLQEYRWYVAELCRLMRTVSGPDLAYCMERVIRKWLLLGLEPNTVVYLAGELFDRLGADSAKPESPKSEGRMTIETRSTGGSSKPEGRVTNQVRSTNPPGAETSDDGRSNDERGTSNERTTRGGGP